MNKEEFRYNLLNFFIIILIIAVGLFAINQFINYKYSVERLMHPCELCARLNSDKVISLSGYKPVNYSNISFTPFLFESKNFSYNP